MQVGEQGGQHRDSRVWVGGEGFWCWGGAGQVAWSLVHEASGTLLPGLPPSCKHRREAGEHRANGAFVKRQQCHEGFL